MSAATALAALLRQRPGPEASRSELAGWLLIKAEVHDRIAAEARDAGNIPAAVQAEVAGTRARLDARDLAVPRPDCEIHPLDPAGITAERGTWSSTEHTAGPFVRDDTTEAGAA